MDNPKIIIADDHPLVQAALRAAIQQVFPGASIREAATMDAVIDEVSKAPHDVDLVLLDLHMPGSAGFTGLLLLQARFPTVPIAIVSAQQDPVTIRKAMAYGAVGYIPKSVELPIMKEAIQRILAGEEWVPPGTPLARRAEDEDEFDVARKLRELSPQQLRILTWVVEGKLNKQIAAKLGIAEQTVKVHVSAILRKLGVLTRTEAAILVERFGKPGDPPVDRYRCLVEPRPRNAFSSNWAKTQMNLGNAIRCLGARESSTARLEEAVSAFHEALKENTREQFPLNWAATQNNLGVALAILGERESGTARLEEAVAAFRKALQELTREHVPLNWATAQDNLGTALLSLGGRESGTARLTEAAAAYREALKENTRERVPLLWAKSTGNEDVALVRLAERCGDAEMAKLAVQQIEAAFTASREAGDAPAATYFEAQLPKARALVQKLANR